MPKELKPSDLEREYFTGETNDIRGRNGKWKTQWVNCRRVELNALSADPHRSVVWVESKLVQHGMAKRLIPPDSVLDNHTRDRREALLDTHILKAIEAAFDIDAKVDAVVSEIVGKVGIESIPEDLVEKWALDMPPSGCPFPASR